MDMARDREFIIVKRDFVQAATKQAFMSILAADISKDGIGQEPDVLKIREIYRFISKTIEMFFDEQCAYFDSYGNDQAPEVGSPSTF